LERNRGRLHKTDPVPLAFGYSAFRWVPEIDEFVYPNGGLVNFSARAISTFFRNACFETSSIVDYRAEEREREKKLK